MSYSYGSRFYARLSTVYRLYWVAGNLNLVWNILNIICCSIHSVFFHSLNWLYVFRLRSTVLASANKESRWFWVLLVVDSRFVIWMYVRIGATTKLGLLFNVLVFVCSESNDGCACLCCVRVPNLHRRTYPQCYPFETINAIVFCYGTNENEESQCASCIFRCSPVRHKLRICD